MNAWPIKRHDTCDIATCISMCRFVVELELSACISMCRNSVSILSFSLSPCFCAAWNVKISRDFVNGWQWKGLSWDCSYFYTHTRKEKKTKEKRRAKKNGPSEFVHGRIVMQWWEKFQIQSQFEWFYSLFSIIIACNRISLPTASIISRTYWHTDES